MKSEQRTTCVFRPVASNATEIETPFNDWRVLECSRQTIWRAARANGLKRGKDGKYRYEPPDPNSPEETDAYQKTLEARPRRGPAVVLIDAQSGRGRTKPLSLECSHEFERLEVADPLRLRPPQVTWHGHDHAKWRPVGVSR